MIFFSGLIIFFLVSSPIKLASIAWLMSLNFLKSTMSNLNENKKIVVEDEARETTSLEGVESASGYGLLKVTDESHFQSVDAVEELFKTPDKARKM